MEGVVFGNNPIGIIQGRLTPSEGRLQCFPVDKWREEFFVAKSLGFDCIELIVERVVGAPNPIWTDDGVEGLRMASEESGVKVFSLCDDQIMSGVLLSQSHIEYEEGVAMLGNLIKQAALAGASRIILPFLEEASLQKNQEGFDVVKQFLEKLAPIARSYNIEIVLEDDLPTEKLKDLVSLTDGGIGVCYDTGNRTSLGFSLAEEIIELGPLVRHVHIKDKDKDGNNVMLGSGRVDFDGVFSALEKINYEGPLILETWRGHDDTEEGKQNLSFIKQYLS